MSAYLYGCIAIVLGLALCFAVLVFLIAQAPSGEEDKEGYHAKE